MTEFSRILSHADDSDVKTVEQLLPLVYQQLRQLAAARLSLENPGQTLQPTALVHEVFLRLVENGQSQLWSNQGHFFSAAAEAMRRILIERARRKASNKRGGQRHRIELAIVEPEICEHSLDILALDEALENLASKDSRAAAVVQLRFFAGLTVPQVAKSLGVSVSTVENDWAYAKSWLRHQLASSENHP